MNRIYNQLLFHLSTDKYLTATQLGEMVLLNEKTIRRYIKDLNFYLCKHGAKIESKQGRGFRLEVYNTDKFSKIYNKENTECFLLNKTRPGTINDRVDYIIACLIKTDDFVYISDLLEYLCISDYTLQSDIKHIKKILFDYKIKLIFKNSEKYKMQATEFNKRLFMVNYQNRYLNIDNFDTSINRKDISAIVLKVLQEYNISMSEVSLNNIIMHLFVAIIRIKNGNNLKFEKDMYDDFPSSDNLSINVSRKICTLLSEKYGVKFNKDEQFSVAIHFLVIVLLKSMELVILMW